MISNAKRCSLIGAGKSCLRQSSWILISISGACSTCNSTHRKSCVVRTLAMATDVALDTSMVIVSATLYLHD